MVKRVMTGRSGRSRTHWKRWLNGVRISGFKTSSFSSTTDRIQVSRPTDETVDQRSRTSFIEIAQYIYIFVVVAKIIIYYYFSHSKNRHNYVYQI